MENKIVCGIASLPERELNLKKTIDSLYNQVDKLHVVLNSYKSIPEFLNKNKIIVHHSFTNKGASAKFINIENCNSYYFSCDDDLIYPHNYVQSMIQKCKEFNNQAIIVVHGGMIATPKQWRGYRMQKIGYHFSHKLTQDQWVQIGGSGTMCIHQPTIQLKQSDLIHNNKVDFDIMVKSQKNNIPILAIARPSRWIYYQNDLRRKFNIFRHHLKNPVDIKEAHEIVRRLKTLKNNNIS